MANKKKLTVKDSEIKGPVLERKKKAVVKSDLDPSPVVQQEKKIDPEAPVDFKDYVEKVKGLIGGNDILYKVISGDFSGDAAKYKDTVFGNLERDLISQCYRLGLSADTCVSHLWSLKGRM